MRGPRRGNPLPTVKDSRFSRFTLGKDDQEWKPVGPRANLCSQAADDGQPIVGAAGTGSMQVQDHRPFLLRRVSRRNEDGVLVRTGLIVKDAFLKSGRKLGRRDRVSDRQQDEDPEERVFDSWVKAQPRKSWHSHVLARVRVEESSDVDCTGRDHPWRRLASVRRNGCSACIGGIRASSLTSASRCLLKMRGQPRTRGTSEASVATRKPQSRGPRGSSRLAGRVFEGRRSRAFAQRAKHAEFAGERA